MAKSLAEGRKKLSPANDSSRDPDSWHAFGDDLDQAVDRAYAVEAGLRGIENDDDLSGNMHSGVRILAGDLADDLRGLSDRLGKLRQKGGVAS